MVKCAVCGSENEPQALFCGTCGSPMPPAAAKPPDPPITTTPEPTTPDGTVIPGTGSNRRDLGIDTGTVVTPPPPPDDSTQVTEADGTSGGPTITCSVCGTINDANRTYCRKCANELKPAPPPPPPPPPPTPARRLSPLALGLGAAAIVVAIALVAVLAMGGGPAASLSPTAGQSASATVLSTVQPSAEAPSAGPTGRVFNFSESKLTGTIAFSRCPSDGSGCAIAIRKADGSAKASQVISATKGSATSPAISFDAKQIIYSVEPGLRVATISSRSWVQHSTGSGDTDGTWSPDGKQVAFAGHRDRDTVSPTDDLELRIDGASSGASVALTSNDVPDTEPSFTFDGTSIVWVQGEGATAELKMIDLSSKDVTDLTTDAFEDHEPVVSPDGNLIAFVSNRGSDGDFQLYLMDLASPTHEIIPIVTGKTNVRHPAWSPGGRYLVFSAGDEGSEDLFLYDLNTSEVTTFTEADGSDLSPTWH